MFDPSNAVRIAKLGMDVAGAAKVILPTAAQKETASVALPPVTAAARTQASLSASAGRVLQSLLENFNARDLSRFEKIRCPAETVSTKAMKQVVAGSPQSALESQAVQFHKSFLTRSEQSIRNANIPEAARQVQLSGIESERKTLGALEKRMSSGAELGKQDRQYLDRLVKQFNTTGGKLEGERAEPQREARRAEPTLQVRRPGIGIEVPSAETVMSQPIELLEKIVAQGEQQLTKWVSENSGLLNNVTLSGRGKKDLEKIESTQRGTYSFGGMPDFMMVWAVKDQRVPAKELAGEFLSAALKAERYSSFKNQARANVDPEPGGVMILRPSHIDKIGNHKNYEYGPDRKPIPGSGYTDDPRHVGEARIPLTPGNYKQTYVGTVRFESYAEFNRGLAALEKTMFEAYQRGEGAKSERERDVHVGVYNAAHPRRDLMQRVMALSITAQVFQTVKDQQDQQK